MKIYLAGPMTGLPNENRPAFHAAAACIRDRGFQCINPAEFDDPAAPPLTWAQCMRRDIAHLVTCDAVAVLPDWQKSKGARLEVHIAAQLGLPIIIEQTWIAHLNSEL